MFVFALATKPKKKGLMEPVSCVRIGIAEGIVGDCRGHGGLFRNRQVTVISLQQWEKACHEVGHQLSWYFRRANICISGHLFTPEDVHKRLVFQGGVILEITGEAKPCGRMDEVYPGLKAALELSWRGGVTCRVIEAGSIENGDMFRIR